ncbi:MAG TPA: tRNA (N6-threonylcarbamoyladenosine(37)-N6)-methyltransferase TrmO [Dehalococcoidia bacterium]|nr:tRNA (N6-threonylcarbamoyladenosine(37)-N6)-methyltransferase TrmO [Dehalococcoidia bacterium]|tara:strand:- start:312 stop:776 length:465 start_codon:yes stop_codon:yes gene_type:complete
MGLIDRFRKFERPHPPERISSGAIGWVQNEVHKPRPHGWEHVESRIVLLPEFAEGLRGIEEFSHLIVVFYMDLAVNAPEKPLSVTVEGLETGIFATRSQLRPNHLGVAAVRLLGLDQKTLRVLGLDAIDGTPVLDLKPYLPRYDAHPDATNPGE